MNQFSTYDILAYVIPGGILIVVVDYFYGEPPLDYSPSQLVILTVASYLTGYLIAAVASKLQGVALNGNPFLKERHVHRLFDSKSILGSAECKRYKALLLQKYGEDTSIAVAYEKAAHYGRVSEIGERLQFLSQQIAFARSMMLATFMAGTFIIINDVQEVGLKHIHVWWVLLFIGSSFLFRMRFVRFWYEYARTVLRELDRQMKDGDK